MKYKVGDRVRIRDDLQANVRYDKIFFTSNMEKYKGQITTIAEIRKDYYCMNIDDRNYWWTDEMLEPAEFTKLDLKPGDRLTARNGNIFQVQEDGQIRSMRISLSNFGAQNYLLNDDLTNSGKLGKDLDIVKVERPQTIWERPEEKTNEELHREMWNWLAENPEKRETDWLEDNGYIDSERLIRGCFACEECGGVCDECPLDSRVIGCEDGLFQVWDMTTDPVTKIRLAEVIANLPWRKADEK